MICYSKVQVNSKSKFIKLSTHPSLHAQVAVSSPQNPRLFWLLPAAAVGFDAVRGFGRLRRGRAEMGHQKIYGLEELSSNENQFHGSQTESVKTLRQVSCNANLDVVIG